jgi:hypothetical protein
MYPKCISLNVGPSDVPRLVNSTSGLCQEFDEVAALRLAPSAGIANSLDDFGELIATRKLKVFPTWRAFRNPFHRVAEDQAMLDRFGEN